MNILVYMSGGFDRHGPSNHLFVTLLEDLLRNGDSVTLIQRTSNGPLPVVPEVLQKYEKFSYKCVFVPVAEKKHLVRRYLYSVIFGYKSRKTLKDVFGKSQIDIVLVQSNPTPYFHLKSIRKFYKGKLVFNIQDLFPGSSIATGKMKNRIMQRFFFWFSRKAYRMVDQFTVISTDSKRLLINQGVDSQKIEVIVNWYNSEEVKEISWDKNRFVEKCNIKKGPFYIQYAGGMGFVFNYMSIVKVAEKLLEYKDIVFLMIGDGSQKNDFVRAVEQKGLTNVVFFPMQPQNIVSDVYSVCDIQIIPLNKNVIGNSVPSKAGLLMSCNRLIINSVDENSDYYKMFNELEIGISVSNDNDDELAEKILLFYNNRHLIEPIVQRAHKFGKDNYAREVSTGKYIRLFSKLIEIEKN